jgi:hypothetical protein
VLTTASGNQTCLVNPDAGPEFNPEDYDVDTPAEDLELPLTFRNITIVDDGGSEQVEVALTGGFIVALYQAGLLTLTGNIRPAHNTGKRLAGKTKTKVNRWVSELLDNRAIIGNISIRLDPTKSESEVWTDDETGEECLTIHSGVLDCAVDSLSRIKAIIQAAENKYGTFDLGTRIQTRVWILDDERAKEVAVNYNTRGDRVNDSTAKFAHAEAPETKLAQKLVHGSKHLGQANIEVLSNAVSWSSHKLTAFNTVARALELSWKGEPNSEAEMQAQAAWLIAAWDALVQVRPEFGIAKTPERQKYRKELISGSAVVIHAIIATMSRMYTDKIDPAAAFIGLAPTDDGAGGWIDPMSIEAPEWLANGVVARTPEGSLSPRNSFQARRGAMVVLLDHMGIADEDD